VIDLLVAGGGPVGLAVAISARIAGMEVVVKEPRESVIDKACGEGLMPEALARLHSIGVDLQGMSFHGIRYIDGARSVSSRFATGSGKGVRRTHLHEVMREQALNLGVRFIQARVDSVSQSDDWVETDGLRSRYLVAADGLHSSIRAAVDLDRPARGPVRFGVRQHFHVEPWTDLVEVYWLKDCELYVTPVGHDMVGVAVLGQRPLGLSASVAAVPELAMRISHAPAASRLLGAGPMRQSATARTRGRVLLVGDAAGSVDAITGEGLRTGFAEAQAAVAAMVSGDVNAYEREWKSITRSYRHLTSALIWAASHRHLRSMIVPTAAAMPWAFGRIVNSVGS